MLFNKRVPLYLQDEISDCGLTCLCMLFAYFGYPLSLPALKDYYGSSSRGQSLLNLKQISKDLGFNATVLKFDLNRIPLNLPCIVHWEHSHFVVIEKITNKNVTICDPSLGRYKVSIDGFTKSATGYAIELNPTDQVSVNNNLLATPFSLFELFSGIKLKSTILVLLTLALMVQVGVLISPIYTQIIIDRVIPSESKEFLIIITLGFLLVTIYTEIVQGIQKLIQFTINTSISKQVHVRFSKKLLQKPLPYFEKRHTSSIYNKQHHLEKIQFFFTENTISIITDFIQLSFGLYLLFLYNLVLATVALVFIIVRIISRRYFHMKTYQKKIAGMSSKLSYDMQFLDIIEAMQAVKLYGAQDQVFLLLDEKLKNKLDSNLDIYKLENVGDFFNNFSKSIERIALLSIGAISVIEGNYTLGILMTALLYRELAASSLDSLVNTYYQYRDLFMFRDQLQELYKIESAKEQTEQPKDVFLNGAIEINNVCFKFSKFEKYTIKNLSFNINPGEKVAIVGPSGQGKTTLAKLICGVLEPNSGSIKIDGFQVHYPDNAWVRKSIGTVMQDDKFLSGSIFENIRFYNKNLNMEDVVNASKIANIYDEISELPMGYETTLNTNTSSLSAGQLQRILIARAVCCNPKLIIMDEATSNLDVENEKIVSCNLAKLNITLIMIAHRPGTINSCDRIIDLSKALDCHVSSRTK